MNERTDVRDTMRGMAIRAGILTVGALIVGGWAGAMMMKAAGTVIKVAAGTGVLLIGAGVGAWEVHKVKQRFQHRGTQPALGA
jgi:hypothetical protein